MKKRAIQLRYGAENWSEYFPGWISPSMSLRSNLTALNELISSQVSLTKHKSNDANVKTLSELALIGVMAWFESFFRDQWASAVNICPRLLQHYAEHNRATSINVLALLDLEVHPLRQIGLMLSEQLDFGTARSINSHFKDLIGITPLGKRDARILERMLHDRNMLVHHGGIVRFQHAKQGFFSTKPLRRRYADSLVLDQVDVTTVCKFVETAARRTTKASVHALRIFIKDQGIAVSVHGRKAIDFLDCWI